MSHFLFKPKQYVKSYKDIDLLNLKKIGIKVIILDIDNTLVDPHNDILEDDAIIHPNFTEAYNFISSPQNIFEFFWLSPPAPIRRGQKGKTILNINNSNNVIAQFYKGWGNATGYFISPHGAKKLLDYCQEWVYDADISMDRYWENKLQYLAFTPACVEPDFSKESNIPVDKGKTKRTMGVKIKRELYKLVDNINKCIYDLSHK